MPHPAESEADFLSWVLDCARVFGWKVAHFRPGKINRTYVNKKGEIKEVWVTPMQGDPGVPDILLARRGVVLLRELKLDGEEPTLEQEEWLEASGGEVWHPSQREEIERVLR